MRRLYRWGQAPLDFKTRRELEVRSAMEQHLAYMVLKRGNCKQWAVRCGTDISKRSQMLSVWLRYLKTPQKIVVTATSMQRTVRIVSVGHEHKRSRSERVPPARSPMVTIFKV